MADTTAITHPEDWAEAPVRYSTDEIKKFIQDTAHEFGVEPELALSVAKAESAYQPSAVSKSGARGVMQLMPDTAKTLGVNPDDVHENIRGGIKYLAQLSKQFGGDRTKTLWAYNAGPGAVAKGVMPEETKTYIPSVTKNLGADDWAEDWQDVNAFPKLPTPKLPELGPSIPSAILRGAARGVGLPDTGEALHNIAYGPTEAMQNIYQDLKSGHYASAAKQLGSTLLDATVKSTPAIGLAGSSVNQLQKAYTAMRERRYHDAITHVGGAMVPTLASAADAPDVIRSGDVAGGIAQGVTGLVGGLAGPRAVDRLPGEGLPEPLSWYVTPKKFQTTSKALIDAFEPKNAIKFQNDLKRALPQVLEADPNAKMDVLNPDQTKNTLRPAITKAKDQDMKQIQEYMIRAEQRGVKIDGNAQADAALAAIPQKLRLENPQEFERLKATFDNYRRTFAPTEYQDFLRTTNAQLDKFYNSLPDTASTTLAANAHTATLEAQAKALRKGLYGAVDPATGPGKVDWKTQQYKNDEGIRIAELQKRWGSLNSLEGAVEDLHNKTLKTPVPTLVQKTLAAYKKISPFSAGKTAINYAADKLAAPLSAQAKVNKALKSYKDYLSPVPSAGYDAVSGVKLHDVPLTPPEGQVPPPIQREMFYEHTPPTPGGQFPKRPIDTVPDYRPIDPNDLVDMIVRHVPQEKRVSIEWLLRQLLPPKE